MPSTNPARKLDTLLLDFLNFLQNERGLAARTRVAYLNDLRQFVRFIDGGNWVVNWTKTISRFESAYRKSRIDARTRDRRVYVARRFADFCVRNQVAIRDWDFIRSDKAAYKNEWQHSEQPVDGMTDLQTAIAGFLSDVERLRSKNTLTAYTADLGGFQRFLQGLSVKGITRDRIVEYLDGLRSCGLKESSVRRIASAIQSFCNWSVTQDLLYEDPSKNINFNTVSSDEPEEDIPVDNLEILVSSKRSHSWFPERDHLVMELLGRYAMRPSEIVRLDCVDVNSSARFIRLGRSRLIEMHEDTVELLNGYLPARSALVLRSEALIVNRRGKRLTTRSLGRIVKQYAVHLGLPETTHPMLLRKASMMATARSGTAMELTMRRVDSFSSAVMEIYNKAERS